MKKVDVYKLTVSDLEQGIWEREFVDTIDVPDDLTLMEERFFAGNKLCLNHKDVRCFDEGFVVPLKGRYTKQALKRLLAAEDEGLSAEELEAKYE